ncbi:DUF397 domain-containing protein [Streptomyces radicis]|uniref:DUF397 domain-containing protein n=1 Tax=Streptomyces radicis TaxID=1750517 RepID=A0A3A9WGS2_9ACTN|nr:DUF397 domain-containing protein [Streptomyces radicis]RKN08624.1 DUF397 domain-containing protein [Streptomyces radicis]RKN21782.1 DUF397 domain-containing protein [Streptomyces radicis]
MTTEFDPSAARWGRSSYSGSNGGDCVQVASVGGGFAVRDSKCVGDGGPVAVFSTGPWQTFLRRAAAEFRP